MNVKVIVVEGGYTTEKEYHHIIQGREAMRDIKVYAYKSLWKWDGGGWEFVSGIAKVP